jgi:hypothetical protein
MKTTIKKIKELDGDCIYEITREGSGEKVQIMIPWEYINKYQRSTTSTEHYPPYGLNFVFDGHYE